MRLRAGLEQALSRPGADLEQTWSRPHRLARALPDGEGQGTGIAVAITGFAGRSFLEVFVDALLAIDWHVAVVNFQNHRGQRRAVDATAMSSVRLFAKALVPTASLVPGG